MTSILRAHLRTVSISFAAASAVALTSLVGTASPAAADDTATLSVLHALPGLTVDVYVDGTKKVDDLEPGQLAGPIALKAGSHRVVAVKSTAPNGDVPGIELTAKLAADGSYTAVVYRDTAAQRIAKLYRNDVDATPAGQGRLTVRHVGAVPTVDVDIDGTTVAKKLSTAEQKSVEIPAGTVEATVMNSGSTKPIIGPAGVVVADGRTTVVYVWGNAKINSQTIAVQTVRVGASAPSAVDAGETGQAADGGGAPLVAALVAVGLGGLLILGRTRRARAAVAGSSPR